MKSLIEEKYLFPIEAVDLASAERRRYYKELVSFAREELLSIPDGYLLHLKDLFFKGGISIEPWDAFRGRAPLLICLSAPFVDRQFVVDTFGSYSSHCAYYDIEMYVMRIFGKAESKYPMVVERFESVVEYMAGEVPGYAGTERLGLCSHYMNLYYNIFYRYRSGGGVRSNLAQGVIEFIEGKFEEIQSLEGCRGTIAAFPKVFFPIFSGATALPEKVYTDPILLGFLQRFFTKQLPPTLQAIAEDVYARVEHPIRFIDGRVEY